LPIPEVLSREFLLSQRNAQPATIEATSWHISAMPCALMPAVLAPAQEALCGDFQPPPGLLLPACAQNTEPMPSCMARPPPGLEAMSLHQDTDWTTMVAASSTSELISAPGVTSPPPSCAPPPGLLEPDGHAAEELEVGTFAEQAEEPKTRRWGQNR
jgi:hypothetical protein